MEAHIIRLSPRPRLRFATAALLAISTCLLCGGGSDGQAAPQAAAQSASSQPPAAAPASASAAIQIAGDVKTPLTLPVADLKTLPRTRVEMAEEGRTVVYEGVRVAEVLKRAGVPLGAELRGDALATYVLASASDGYRVLFSLAELDPALTQNDVIIADTVDGQPLFAYQGPARIVAPKDARGARSIRMLQRIDVVRAGKGAAAADKAERFPREYEWTLPKGFPAPAVPADNPISHAKVELGRHLFYDTRLSGNARHPAPAAISRRAPSRMAERPRSPRPSCTTIPAAVSRSRRGRRPTSSPSSNR